MLENFQLAVIAVIDKRTELLRVPLHQGLQDTLAENWQAQFLDFMNEVEEIPFDAGYNPEAHERFGLDEYELPDWLAEETSQTVQNLDAINEREDVLGAIKGVVAFALSDDREVMLFQNFSKSHVIRPGGFLFLQGNTYETADRPGLTLGTKLAAVFLVEEQKLLFHNFRSVNSFLPLSEFHKEATEQEIAEVLSHDLLAPEDALATAKDANQWSARRFAMLKSSGILDRYTADEIREHSAGYAVDVRVENGKIVFPVERAAAKRLLQFLNEELFRGAITDVLYETNSKRGADA